MGNHDLSTREITVDGFCGGGGWSTGFEQAIGRPVDIGINHDAAAIAMHRANHPHTKHYNENIFEVDPYEACAGRPVGWAHFSPDCTHFSRAKGGTPVKKSIRGLAWVVVKWAGTVKPRIISMENVIEFTTWGPLTAKRDPKTGRCLKVTGWKRKKPVTAVAELGERVPLGQQLLIPDKRRAGETFRHFVRILEDMGYQVAWWELCAADYGAPTSRRRFFLIARRDGKPIVKPEPTHATPKSEAVRSGNLLPWRTAGEIIDWEKPCPSIFDRKKPLAENTLRRIARGIQKFVLENPEPFIVQANHAGEGFQGQSLDRPLPTVTGKLGYGIVTPIVTKFQQNSIGQSTEEPLDTVMAGATRFGLVSPTLIQYHSEQSEGEHRGQDVKQPLQTVDTSNRYGMVTAFLSKYYAGGYTGAGSAIDEPVHTVTAIDHNSLVVSNLIHLNRHCDGRSLENPLPTVAANGNHFGEVRALLIKFYGTGTGQGLSQPLDTVTAKDRFGLVTIHGELYAVADIGLRMLTPRELYAAQGFPPDYIIDHDDLGRPYTKSEQVRKAGNSVPPPFATALVRANWPEAYVGGIDTMEQLNERIAGLAS